MPLHNRKFHLIENNFLNTFQLNFKYIWFIWIRFDGLFILFIYIHKCYALLCWCVLCTNRYAVYDNYLLFMFDLTLFEFFQSNLINLYCIRIGKGNGNSFWFKRRLLETSQQWGEFIDQMPSAGRNERIQLCIIQIPWPPAQHSIAITRE